MEQFLKLPADVLLNKFGSGGHAPGSGSATALIGLVAANLAYTVAQLTTKRDAYKTHHTEAAVICTRIHTILIPKLTELFQRDAEAFNKVVESRVTRDNASDATEKERLSAISLSEQKLATAIPFEIANVCMELIDHAARLFDVGFRAARGDTGVALTAAVAGVLSAVFVINLNLIPFKGNYWALQRRHECDQLQQVAVEKYEAALMRVNELRAEDVDAVEEDEKVAAVQRLLSRSKPSYTDEEIDERASELRALVWKTRDDLAQGRRTPFDNSDLHDPEVALRLLGYSFSLVESLGIGSSPSGSFEVAGLLEALPGTVSVSRQMKPDVRLFTSAHELGHIILHPQLKEAHRDRPLDGSVLSRTQIEKEADRFASSYLMPAKLVRERFLAIFSTEEFTLSETTAFALLKKGEIEARQMLKSLRGLSLALASTERFNGRQVVCLAKQFKVSPTAMAIRLEELNLLRYA